MNCSVVDKDRLGDWLDAYQSANQEKLGFSGHQTFVFRNGWLKKAVDAVREDPSVFTAPDAIVRLGVGKNMVQSIRHWGLATGVLEQHAARGVTVSVLGELLLERWDPYLEDPASLWLLHWMLASNPRRAAAWYWLFNRYARPDFTKDHVAQSLSDMLERLDMRTSASSVSRDIDCIMRMYLPSQGARRTGYEDNYDCPLGELALFVGAAVGESVHFNIGPKPTLPTEVVGFATVRYWRQSAKNRQVVPFSELLYSEGSPGQLFKLDEQSLAEYIDNFCEMSADSTQFDETAGLRQLYFSQSISSQDILEHYYNGKELTK